MAILMDIYMVLKWDLIGIYPLVMTNSLLLNMVYLEIVDLPFLQVVMFHNYVNVYQRVLPVAWIKIIKIYLVGG